MKDEKQLLYEKLRREAIHMLQCCGRDGVKWMEGRISMAVELGAIDQGDYCTLNNMLVSGKTPTQKEITDVADMSDADLARELGQMSEKLGVDCPLIRWFGDYAVWEPAVGAARIQLEEAYQGMIKQLAVGETECVAEEAPEMSM